MKIKHSQCYEYEPSTNIYTVEGSTIEEGVIEIYHNVFDDKSFTLEQLQERLSHGSWMSGDQWKKVNDLEIKFDTDVGSETFRIVSD